MTLVLPKPEPNDRHHSVNATHDVITTEESEGLRPRFASAPAAASRTVARQSIFTTLFMQLVERSPSARRRLWRFVYETLAKFRKRDDFVFMNYGYLERDASRAVALDPADEPMRLVLQLYERVVQGIDLSGKSVLEVGVGRGGGASYLTRYHRPKRYVGIDISRHNIEFCNERHHLDGLSFRCGDAEALPFPDETFDVVVNVESSHCYGSFPKFVSEVARVLRRGGIFAFTDLRGERSFGIDAAGLRAQLVSSGLEIEEFTDISEEVLGALDALSAPKEYFVAEFFPKFVHGPIRDLFGTGGTRFVEELRNGKAQYITSRLRKL